MSRARRARAFALPVLVGAYTLFVAASGYVEWASRPRRARLDSAAVYDAIHRDTRKVLERRGIDSVGYVYLAPEGAEPFPGDHLLTQFALAPVVVHTGPEHPFVIGRFSDRDFMRRNPVPEGLVAVEEIGGGVVLYRSRTEP